MSDQHTAALIQIQGLQPKRMAWFREKEVVFDKAPFADGHAWVEVGSADYWQNIAFQIYTDLCEAESIARSALQT